MKASHGRSPVIMYAITLGRFSLPFRGIMEVSIAKMQTSSPLFYISLASRSSSSAIIKFRLQRLDYILVSAATFPQSPGYRQNANKNQAPDSKQSTRISLLEKTCDLIRNFPEYVYVVVSVARKTDGRHWADLFSAAGRSTELFEECFQRRWYRTAACYILIKVDTMILNGDLKDMICQAVEQIQSDLLLVGSCGLGMIKRLVVLHTMICSFVIMMTFLKVSTWMMLD